jgi:tRNA pseudouridine38-40 synthase
MGAAYAGFQRQPDKETVQATLEDALSRVTQEDIHVIGSGRTDAGAHALFQVVAFSTESRLRPNVLQRAANALLPRDVGISGARDVPESFHPRFDARSRVYRYVIWNRPVRSPFWEGRGAHVKPHLDELAMHRAIQYLQGRCDFASFVPANFKGARERTVRAARCWRDGWTVKVEIEAEGFMRQMVRSIVGTLIDVGRGKIDVTDFEGIVLARDRTQAGRTAPAHGLYLVSVCYDDPETLVEAQSLPADFAPSNIAITPEEKL